MELPSPGSSTSNSAEVQVEQPLLACVRTLKLQYQHGGVDKRGFDILYRMIEMMSAIGWEVHVIFSSKIARVGSVKNMEWYAQCILQGCTVFQRNMRALVRRAMEADALLPEFEKDKLGFETKVKRWERKLLRTLHEPTGNDRRLFELMLNHYDDVALQRLIQLNVRKPHYKLEHVVESAKSVYIALEELHHLAQQADHLVLALHQKYKTGRAQPSRDNTERMCSMQQQAVDPVEALELLPATIYQPSEKKRVARVEPYLSKSFGVAEEELARRGHIRAATVSETYTATGETSVAGQQTSERPLQSATLGTRRKGTNVPRIFTGSFSQLESDLRKLQLDKVETPVTHSVEGHDPVKVRDFGASPAISPRTSQGTAPLQRREALVSRNIEIQDRVINGELVKSRRPSTKTRAKTVDDSTGGFEGWLKEVPSVTSTGSGQSPAGRPGSQRHRENTL